jgi:hypothetical protein
MKEQRNDIINIPLEFQIACTIRRLVVPDVLQTFIDHVSFYYSVNSPYAEGFREATNVILEYSTKNRNHSNHASFGDDKNNKEFAIKCIKDVLAWGAKRGMSDKKKHAKCKPIIKQLHLSMEHLNSIDKIYLDEENRLTFTDDFSVLCNIHRHHPKEYLEYFMSRISLADADARVGLKKIDENPSMGFFQLVMRGLGDLIAIVNMTELEVDFIDKVQQLHYEVFLIRDLDKRRAIYQEFYLNYYNKLTNQSNTYGDQF